MDAERALREALKSTCNNYCDHSWDGHGKVCHVRRSTINRAVLAAYLLGGHDEAHGNRRPAWLPAERSEDGH